MAIANDFSARVVLCVLAPWRGHSTKVDHAKARRRRECRREVSQDSCGIHESDVATATPFVVRGRLTPQQIIEVEAGSPQTNCESHRTVPTDHRLRRRPARSHQSCHQSATRGANRSDRSDRKNDDPAKIDGTEQPSEGATLPTNVKVTGLADQWIRGSHATNRNRRKRR